MKILANLLSQDFKNLIRIDISRLLETSNESFYISREFKTARFLLLFSNHYHQENFYLFNPLQCMKLHNPSCISQHICLCKMSHEALKSLFQNSIKLCPINLAYFDVHSRAQVFLSVRKQKKITSRL